jgi:hypothetical protein
MQTIKPLFEYVSKNIKSTENIVWWLKEIILV